MRLAPRASRSTVRIWLHRTTPCVSVPEPLNGTAKPVYRVNSPPCVIGAMGAGHGIRQYPKGPSSAANELLSRG